MDEEWKERREKKMELSRIDMNQQDLLPRERKKNMLNDDECSEFDLR